uniref:Uncharacterized protein n=1 Tax=Rhizophora mucronata TaxID=61149 RepID=A0A2P2NAP4_RHIMU
MSQTTKPHYMLLSLCFCLFVLFLFSKKI